MTINDSIGHIVCFQFCLCINCFVCIWSELVQHQSQKFCKFFSILIWCQAIFWTTAHVFSVGHLGTDLNKIWMICLYFLSRKFIWRCHASHLVQVPIAQIIFHRISSLLETCCTCIHGQLIAMIFCTCPDSTVVMSSTKCCRNHLITLWLRTIQNFHRIWNMVEKSLVK